MVTIESALRVINQYGGNLDMTTGKLNIPSRVLEKAEIKKAVHVLKEAGSDKVKAVHRQKMPYINDHGVLVVPFDSNPLYHWWAGGQSILETLRELKASQEVIALYGPGGSA
jgi:predicted glycosyl hydrolase (DUF1957 family)